jgi:molybdate transport system substrate-binding protein
MLRCLLVAVALLAASPASAEAPRRELAVAAAASLKSAAEALARGFEAEQPGVGVTVTLGASGAVFAQIRNGAPFDVFLSADRDYPARVVTAGLGAAADERVYAIGTLVAWLPPGSTLDLETRGPAALADPSVKRVAIANPAVAPHGRAAEAALKAAGVLEAVRPKLVLGTSVAQAAQFATTGAADVAFLPRSLAREGALASGTVVPLASALPSRVEQSGIVLAAARDPGLARAFLGFVIGPRGRAILAAHGYDLPSP